MDPYTILQIPPTASLADIKTAYHKLALLHHPDKSSGESEIFNSINTAYNTLSNPVSRLAHDNALKESQNLCIDTISEEELSILEDGNYSYDCRCGDVYLISKVMLHNVFTCESCSLSIRVEIDK
jgi:diphthamide biosynthesis protein 4